jgi:hypothetical protein
MMETQALDFPKINAVLRTNGTGEVTINGTSHAIEAADEAAVLTDALRLITETAVQLGRPVRVSTTDPDGQGLIIVSPDGVVSEAAPIKPASRRRGHFARYGRPFTRTGQGHDHARSGSRRPSGRGNARTTCRRCAGDLRCSCHGRGRPGARTGLHTSR